MKLLKIYSTVLTFVFLAFNLTAQTTTVSGRVLNKLGVPSTNVEITLTATNFDQTTTTDAEGNYEFTEVPVNEEFSINAIKEDDHLNGVSTFDLVFLTRHILGINIFETNADFIAMDVNNSGANTAFDLVQARRLILGITEEFPNNTAWRIVNSTALESANFAQGSLDNNLQATNPFMTTTDATIINFTAIKIGDANGNAIP